MHKVLLYVFLSSIPFISSFDYHADSLLCAMDNRTVSRTNPTNINFAKYSLLVYYALYPRHVYDTNNNMASF